MGNNFKNKHHIFPKSRGGTNAENNIMLINAKTHDNFHRVFGNELIKEQIATILSFNSLALSEQFKQDLFSILEESDRAYYYKNGVFVNTNFEEND